VLEGVDPVEMQEREAFGGEEHSVLMQAAGYEVGVR
jgi:hypothetical protein